MLRPWKILGEAINNSHCQGPGPQTKMSTENHQAKFWHVYRTCINMSGKPVGMMGRVTVLLVGSAWHRLYYEYWKDQGWGLLSQFPLFHYLLNFSASPKYMLAIEYHIHIWQVSPQLSCRDTCQIWMWCKESNRYLGRIELLLMKKLMKL